MYVSWRAGISDIAILLATHEVPHSIEVAVSARYALPLGCLFCNVKCFFRHKGTKAQSSTKIISNSYCTSLLLILTFLLFISFCHKGTKAQSFTNWFHAKLAREQSREGVFISPFGGSRGLPIPYSLFLFSYYLFQTTQRPFQETLLRT